MKIEIEPTDQFTKIEGAPVRVWKGRTEEGKELWVFVRMIAVEEEDCGELAPELVELFRTVTGEMVPLKRFIY